MQTDVLALLKTSFADDLSSHQLPTGTTAQVAVYHDHMAPVAVIRRILLRMKAWRDWVLSIAARSPCRTRYLTHQWRQP
jgi:hypothetical protein